jgi:hypothetical protein
MNDEITQHTTIVGVACDSPDRFHYLANITPADHDPESTWSLIVEVRDWLKDDQDDSFEDEIWLCAIDGDSQRGIYSVSADGDILHLRRDKWRKLKFANDTALNALSVPDANRVFFGGDEGLLGVIEQGKITTFTIPNGECINAVHASPTTGQVIAVGNAGTAFRYLDGHWHDLLPPTDACLMSVCIADNGTIHIGAEKGLIFCLQGDVWREIDLNDDVIVHGMACFEGALYCALGEKGLIGCVLSGDDVDIQPVKDWTAYELSLKGQAVFGAGDDYLFRYHAGVWARWQIEL